MISRRRGKLHPYRVFFWTAVVIGIALAVLQRYPITMQASDPELAGRPATFDGRGDILVVLDEAGMQAAAREGRVDRSWAWVDMIRQEVGPVTTIEIDALNQASLRAHRIVVLSSSAAAAPEAHTRIEALDLYVREGGVLALELPTGALRAHFAADGNGGWRRPAEITAVEGVDGPLRDALTSTPLLTRFLGSTRPLPDTETMLAFDGAPVIYTRRIGQGEVVVFDFEVGAQLTRLQQGMPGDDGEIRPRRAGDAIRTFDLAATPATIGASIPYADLLERYIVHEVLGHRVPVFSIWPYPQGRNGALITSHDSRSVLGRPLWMSIHERAHDARSTTFIAAPADETVRLVDDVELAGHAALLWVLRPNDAGLYRRYGAFGAYPLRQTLSLVGQLEHLESALGDQADVRGVRLWDGRWTEAFTQPYRVMDAAELRYSTSYGPAPGVPQGLVFGTCQPFMPVDLDGQPFRVQEVPVCFHDPSDPEDVARFDAALAFAHEHAFAVHLLTSADRFRVSPDLAAFDVWRDALRRADRDDMWIGGAGELVSFWRRRGQAELRVIATEVGARGADGAPRTIAYTVEAETSGRGLVMMVPATFGDLRFESATRAGQATLPGLIDQVDTESSTWLGEEVRLIPLNPGFTTVGIRYER
jgi:hypothetical protein